MTIPLRPFCLLLFLACGGLGCERPHDVPAAAGAAEEAMGATAARARLEAAGEGGRQILRAIEAHGGLDAWYAAPTSSYTWEYANVGADLQFKSYLVADNRSRHVYHELLALGDYGDPQPVTGRFAWDGADAWIYPNTLDRINPRFWATTGYYFEQIPFVLADPGVRYEILPADSLDGLAYDLVRASFASGVGDAPGDTYTLYLDRQSGRVAALRYTVTYGRETDPGAPPRETLFYYEDYVTVDGLTVPTHFRGYRFEDGQAGDFRNEAWADSISFRRPFDPAQLVAPPDARVAPAPGTD